MNIQDIGGTKGATWTDFDTLIISESRGVGVIEIKGVAWNPVLTQSMSDLSIDNQGWYWSDAWQGAEKNADEALMLGDVEAFDNMDDFINTL